MLTNYLTRTRQLLQNPSSASTQIYSDADLTSYINQARGQLAGEAECVRVNATIATVLQQREYLFSALNTGVAATNGVRGAIHVRSVRYSVASGFQWVAPRAWPWFEFFYLNNPVPDSGAPTDWAQYAQGSSGTSTGSNASGSFFITPLPDMIYTLTCDCCCYPIDLVNDSTVEAIPFLFTDCVAYFAAYLALLSAQTNARRADAEAYFGYYSQFLQRARQFANPSVLRGNYEQATDPTLMAKLGLQKQAGG